VVEPLDIELNGITTGIVFVVELTMLGSDGAIDNPLAFLAVTLTTIGSKSS
jgi:hypothetical protein